MPDILTIKDLRIGFASEKSITEVVKGVSFSLAKAETLGIVGESGSGKSVSSLAIMQLLPEKIAKITAGEILFNSSPETEAVNIVKLSQKEMQKIRGNRISMIFQEPMTSLNPVYKCGKQVVGIIKVHKKVSFQEAKKQALALFEEVRLPDPERVFNSYPHQLSGGQKQRVMIAMALACNPDILIADEPTTALDVSVQKTILELLKNLQKKYGMGIIFITHDLGVITQIADKVAVLYKGEVVETGTVSDVFNHPQHPYTKGLLACRPVLGKRPLRLQTVADFLNNHIIFITHDLGVITQIADKVAVLYKGEVVEAGDVADVFNHPQHPYTKGLLACRPVLGKRPLRLQTVADFLNNHSVENFQQEDFSRQERHEKLYAKEPILHLKNVLVSYPTKKTWWGKVTTSLNAVNHVSFNVYEGETLGLVGESGCGKTTLGRAILQLIHNQEGEISYRGVLLNKMSERELRIFRSELQIIFQDPYSSLNPRMTTGEIITEPLMVHDRKKTGKECRELVLDLMQKVGLEESQYNRYPHEFSGGQRQRICIARALILNPKLVICDESVSALDVSVQAQVLNLLNDLKKALNLTYVFISHDLSVVKYMSDRMLVMQSGNIVEMGEADQIYKNPTSDYTRKLIEAIPK